MRLRSHPVRFVKKGRGATAWVGGRFAGEHVAKRRRPDQRASAKAFTDLLAEGLSI